MAGDGDSGSKKERKAAELKEERGKMGRTNKRKWLLSGDLKMGRVITSNQNDSKVSVTLIDC